MSKYLKLYVTPSPEGDIGDYYGHKDKSAINQDLVITEVIDIKAFEEAIEILKFFHPHFMGLHYYKTTRLLKDTGYE